MKHLARLLACLATLTWSLAQDGTDLTEQIRAATLIQTGQPAPQFTCRTTEGREFSLAAQQGRVVLLYFFAASVPFSHTEMKYLQTEILDKLSKRTDFTLLCLGRGLTREEVVRISGENGLRLPMAADADGAIYRRMFTKFVPRTVLVAKDGTIAWLASGSKEFEGIVRLQQALDVELRRGG